MNNYLKHIFITLFMLGAVTGVRAQLQAVYTFPEKMPNGYITPFEESYAYTTSLAHKGYTKEEWEKVCKGYEIYQYNVFTSGEIYINWEQADDYLNKVFRKILPDNLKDDKNLRLYLARDGDFNALTHLDGSIFLNIGVLAEANNEAALAEVLGHELTHYANQDTRKRFEANADKILRHKDQKKSDDNLPELTNAHTNQKQERACDSVGAINASNAGYSADGILSTFYFMRLLENEYGEKKSFSTVYTDGKNHSSNMYKLLADHPEAIARIEAIKSLKLPSTGKNFIIDSAKFMTLQKYARIEQLSILLENTMYKKCIEKAFVFHLLEPENNYYVYMLLEAMRRQMYLSPSYKKFKFIAQDHPAIYKKQQTVFNNLLYIIKDSLRYTKIKAKEYLDTLHPKFITYTDAFKYFQYIAEKRNIKEAYLTMALFYADSTNEANSYIEQYVADDSAPMAAFAKRFKFSKNEMDISTKNEKDLIIIPRVKNFEYLEGGWKQTDENVYNYTHIENAMNKFVYNKFKNKEVITLTDLVKNNFKKNVYYRQLISTSALLEHLSSSNDDINYFVLDPELWNALNSSKLRSIKVLMTESFAIKAKSALPFGWFCGGTVYTGSLKYFYNVSYFGLDTGLKSGDINFYSNTTYYKMTVPNLLNSIYYAVKNH